jgi:hypothetical protein
MWKKSLVQRYAGIKRRREETHHVLCTITKYTDTDRTLHLEYLDGKYDGRKMGMCEWVNVSEEKLQRRYIQLKIQDSRFNLMCKSSSVCVRDVEICICIFSCWLSCRTEGWHVRRLEFKNYILYTKINIKTKWLESWNEWSRARDAFIYE